MKISFTVAKTGKVFECEMPESDRDRWLVAGIARVLNDSHAGLKSENFATDDALHAACVAAMAKRFAAGPGAEVGSRTADPVESEYRALLVKRLGGDVKARDAETAFRAAATAKKATEEQIVAALAAFRRAAEAAVAARAAAPDLPVGE